MPDHPVVRFAERLLVALLRVYPSSFRRRVGADLVATFRDRCRDEWMSGGWLGLVRYWTRTAISVAKDGMLERLANRNRSFTPNSTPRHMDSLLQDLHYTVRSFARRPAFFLVALITVALGIGSTTTIYSVVDGVLFRALPYPIRSSRFAEWCDGVLKLATESTEDTENPKVGKSFVVGWLCELGVLCG